MGPRHRGGQPWTGVPRLKKPVSRTIMAALTRAGGPMAISLERIWPKRRSTTTRPPGRRPSPVASKIAATKMASLDALPKRGRSRHWIGVGLSHSRAAGSEFRFAGMATPDHALAIRSRKRLFLARKTATLENVMRACCPKFEPRSGNPWARRVQVRPCSLAAPGTYGSFRCRPDRARDRSSMVTHLCRLGRR